MRVCLFIDVIVQLAQVLMQALVMRRVCVIVGLVGMPLVLMCLIVMPLG